MTDTILDQLENRIRAASAHDPNALAEPVAVLWPDEHKQWAAIVPQLSERLQILSLGDYDENRTGPAYWLRCAVAGMLPNDDEKPMKLRRVQSRCRRMSPIRKWGCPTSPTGPSLHLWARLRVFEPNGKRLSSSRPWSENSNPSGQGL